MNPKKQVQLCHKLVTLTMLLTENLDELNATTPEIKEYKESLIRIGELLIDQIADTMAIQSSTYFQDLSNKVDTIIRKNLNTEM